MRLALAKKANIQAGSAVKARPTVTLSERRRPTLFNTMSQRKEPLNAVPGETLRMFVCGPTVQSFIHVGHARTYVFYDVLARYLEHLGVRMDFMINITDVDDRITEAAKREGVRPGDVVEKYAKAFHEDLQGLGVNSVTRFERVSGYVQVMI